MIYNIIMSPLEQFQVLPVYVIKFGALDFTITNVAIIYALMFMIAIIFVMAIFTIYNKGITYAMIPTKGQVVLEVLYKTILSLVVDNIKHEDAPKFFPTIFAVFIFILVSNLIGLVPYSFTVTSHLIMTLNMAFSLFLGINVLCVTRHGMKFFGLFLPAGTSVGFAFLLVPIEMISYLFKPISLSVRLFANMMAGHTLLKVIAGFACVLMSKSGILFFLHYIPLLILVPLFALELGVAIIQAFVFTILICIYVNDALNLH